MLFFQTSKLIYYILILLILICFTIVQFDHWRPGRPNLFGRFAIHGDEKLIAVALVSFNVEARAAILRLVRGGSAPRQPFLRLPAGHLAATGKCLQPGLAPPNIDLNVKPDSKDSKKKEPKPAPKQPESPKEDHE